MGSMDDSNVIPFRKRPPTRTELEHFRKMTRNWHPQVRQLMFPELVALDQREPPDRK